MLREQRVLFVAPVSKRRIHFYDDDAGLTANLGVRVDNIRGEATTVSLCTGLVFVEIDPFYESLFFVGVISFLMTFLLMLIRDLDNPFGYYEESSAEDVSLHPLEDFITRMQAVIADDGPLAGERKTKRAPAVLQQTL